MLKDSLAQIYLKVFLLQGAIAVLLALVLLPFGLNFSLSAIAGAASVLIGNACYMLVETRALSGGLGNKAQAKKRLGGRVFGRHLFAELLKIVVIAGLLGLAFASGWFNALWLVIAASVVIIGHVGAFFIIR